MTDSPEVAAYRRERIEQERDLAQQTIRFATERYLKQRDFWMRAKIDPGNFVAMLVTPSAG